MQWQAYHEGRAGICDGIITSLNVHDFASDLCQAFTQRVDVVILEEDFRFTVKEDIIMQS